MVNSQIMGNRAVKILNFVKGNLTNCSITIIRQAYLALVRPIMEYASPVWDPYYNSDIYRLDRVQRRAARWALSDYSREPSVIIITQMAHFIAVPFAI